MAADERRRAAVGRLAQVRRGGHVLGAVVRRGVGRDVLEAGWWWRSSGTWPAGCSTASAWRRWSGRRCSRLEPASAGGLRADGSSGTSWNVEPPGAGGRPGHGSRGGRGARCDGRGRRCGSGRGGRRGSDGRLRRPGGHHADRAGDVGVEPADVRDLLRLGEAVRVGLAAPDLRGGERPALGGVALGVLVHPADGVADGDRDVGGVNVKFVILTTVVAADALLAAGRPRSPRSTGARRRPPASVGRPGTSPGGSPSMQDLPCGGTGTRVIPEGPGRRGAR